MKEGFTTDFKRFFLRGLAAVLPTLLTLAIIFYIFGFLDNYLGRYVNVAVQWIVVQGRSILARGPVSLTGPDEIWDTVKDLWTKYHLSWLGFGLALVVIYVFGRFVASFIGRGAWGMVERWFIRIPVLRQVYPYVKQVTDFLLAERQIPFSRVVAVEYPRKGIWSMGFVTAPGMRTLQDRHGSDRELLTVFVPSSPTPVTGYVITVRREEVTDLPLTIDEALRFAISCGVVIPPSQKLDDKDIQQALRAFLPPQRKETQS